MRFFLKKMQKNLHISIFCCIFALAYVKNRAQRREFYESFTAYVKNRAQRREFYESLTAYVKKSKI